MTSFDKKGTRASGTVNQNRNGINRKMKEMATGVKRKKPAYHLEMLKCITFFTARIPSLCWKRTSSVIRRRVKTICTKEKMDTVVLSKIHLQPTCLPEHVVLVDC